MGLLNVISFNGGVVIWELKVVLIYQLTINCIIYVIVRFHFSLLGNENLQ